jgi:hypothetical protein
MSGRTHEVLQPSFHALKRLKAETNDDSDTLLPSTLDQAFPGELELRSSFMCLAMPALANPAGRVPTIGADRRIVPRTQRRRAYVNQRSRGGLVLRAVPGRCASPGR